MIQLTSGAARFSIRAKAVPIIIAMGLLFWVLYQYASKKQEDQFDEESLIKYRPPPQSGVNTVGRRMEMDQVHWKPLLQGYTQLHREGKLMEHLTVADAQDFVFVTAASGEFFHGALNAIHTVQKLFPQKKIFFYDMEEEGHQDDFFRNRISALCGVSYRLFNFNLYPKHIRQLGFYAWKPIIVFEMMKEFSGVLWIDSSIRFESNNFTKIFENAVLSGGTVALTSAGHSNYAVTHPQMYVFLPTSMDGMTKSIQHEANCVLFYRTRFVFSKVVWWWVLCAHDPLCIAPTDQKACNDPYSSMDRYADCHRYDQSALNILLANHFTYNHDRYYGGVDVARVRRMSNTAEYVSVCSPGKAPVGADTGSYLVQSPDSET